MKSLPLILAGLVRGMVDSTNFAGFLSYMVRSKDIARLFWECLAMNMMHFVGVLGISKLLASVQPDGVFSFVWEAVFSVSWVLPMYLVTQILGVTWYAEMYRAASNQKRIATRSGPAPVRPPSFDDVSEWVMKFVVTLLFGILAAIVAIVPTLIGLPSAVGGIPSFLMCSWLHAFYCFDYRFAEQGVTDRKGNFIPIKLSIVTKCFDLCWAYYLGFGATHIGCRVLMEYYGVPVFPKWAVLSALFPVNVIMTVDAIPGPETPLFRPPIFTWFYSMLSRRIAASKARTRDSTESTAEPPSVSDVK